MSKKDLSMFDAKPSKKPVEPACFSPQEAADYLRVTRTTIYNLMEDGTLPNVKIATCRRIPRSALDALLAVAA
jgi:excisionase family DNA binding protein